MNVQGIEINKIYCEDNLDTMSRMPNDFVDLVVTSPPYDDLRTYGGFTFDFESVAKELHRVVKKGGIVVWIVGDGMKNGSESGTSFKQALFFKEIGFNLHDTMIWQKHNFSNPAKNRYHQIYDYMFIFSKGKPKTFNPIKDRPNIEAGKAPRGRNTRRQRDGTFKENKIKVNTEFGMRYNIWRVKTEMNPIHPAQFSEQIASDHIISWSNEGDLVYDPFVGSGTTAKMAVVNKRNYIASELKIEYCELSNKRLNN